MATIESLDLATLTNNPQSIAEALEDVLETTSGNIGTLKTSAQDDHDHIEGLRTSAQDDHDAIEALLDTSNPTKQQYTTLLNNWVAHDIQSNHSGENGVIIQNMGRIWIANISCYKNFSGTATGWETLVDISNDFTVPGGSVTLGMQHYGSAGQDDYTSVIEITTSGDVNIYFNNTSDNYHTVAGNFMGLDVS